jgi:hypothetical protein
MDERKNHKRRCSINERQRKTRCFSFRLGGKMIFKNKIFLYGSSRIFSFLKIKNQAAAEAENLII